MKVKVAGSSQSRLFEEEGQHCSDRKSESAETVFEWKWKWRALPKDVCVKKRVSIALRETVFQLKSFLKEDEHDDTGFKGKNVSSESEEYFYTGSSLLWVGEPD